MSEGSAKDDLARPGRRHLVHWYLRGVKREPSGSNVDGGVETPTLARGVKVSEDSRKYTKDNLSITSQRNA